MSNRIRIEWEKKDAEKNFISDLKKVIALACGCSGQNYKLKVTIRELVDYKLKNKYEYSSTGYEAELFKLYVSVIDDIIELVKIHWPFIDLNGIDMDWTSQQIIDVATAAYKNSPTITLDEMKKHCKKS